MIDMIPYKTPDVIAVGHLCMDKICFCEDYPEENTSRRVLQFSEHPGGTVSQAMAALSRLGVKTGYLGDFGSDAAARFLHEDCRREGIDVSRCRFHPDTAHAFTTVAVNVRRNTRTFFSYHGKFPPLSFSPEDERYLAGARLLHLDNTDPENALAAAKLAKKLGVPVSLDGSSMAKDNEKNWALVRLTDILITNDRFPSRLTGIPDRAGALLEIFRQVHPKVLISTAGEHGCLAFVDGMLRHFPAFSVKTVDTTGAGDVFHGAFLYSLLHEMPLAVGIRFASAAAAISCGAPGGRDGIPNLAQVEAFLAAHPE